MGIEKWQTETCTAAATLDAATAAVAAAFNFAAALDVDEGAFA